MLFTTHIAVGAALGLITGNPYASLAGGLISHHLLDRVPHFDIGSFYSDRKESFEKLSDLTIPEKTIVVADLVIGIAVLFWLIKISINPAAEVYIGDLWTKENTLIALGALGGILPDVFYNFSKMVKDKTSWFLTVKPFKFYHQFHERFHQVLSLNYWYIGLVIQAALVSVAIWWILREMVKV